VAEVQRHEPPPPPPLQPKGTDLPFDDPMAAFRSKSTAELIRSLLVYKACQMKLLVMHAHTILHWSRRIMGTKLTNLAVMPFYRQFVAGELRRVGMRAEFAFTYLRCYCQMPHSLNLVPSSPISSSS
jgi:hypothetical protein